MKSPQLHAYPLKFIPVYKDYIWGGRNLEKLGRTLPPGRVAESWEISGHPDGVSFIANGEYGGMAFPDYLRCFGVAAIGRALPREFADDFPLLVKLIDANQRLSVQVHPDDDYADRFEQGQRGKNEMWVILSAEPGAEIIYGLQPGTDRNVFARAVAEGRVGDCLQTVGVRAGDVFEIPAGMVHGLGDGILLAEIQQSSNLTYRIYDYNRRDSQGNTRPLHIEKALEVVDFNAGGGRPSSNEKKHPETILADNPYFHVERKRNNKMSEGMVDGERFVILLFLSGKGILRHRGGEIHVGPAETFYLPAAMGAYQLEGPLEFIEVKIP